MRLTEFDGKLDELDYPTSSDDIIEAYGREALSLQSGEETVAQVLGRCGPESFDDPDEVRMTLYGSLCDDAIGRKGYSDRDPPVLGEAEPVSF